MSASGNKLNLDELAQDLIATYLKGLGTVLGDNNTAIIDANVFKTEANKWANLDDLDKGGYFDGKGNLVRDFPIEEKKMQRFKDLMKEYCDDSMTDRQKFILVCSNFPAAQKVSEDKLTVATIKLQNEPALVNLAKQIFEEIQFQVLRTLSQVKPEKYQQKLASLFQEGAVRDLVMLAKADAAFVIKLSFLTPELSAYKDHLIDKRFKEIKQGEGKKKGAKRSDAEMLAEAKEVVQQTEKYQEITKAIKAIMDYKQNRNVFDLSQTASEMQAKESSRPKSGMWKHPLSKLIKKFDTQVKEELALRAKLPNPSSPTETRSPSISEGSGYSSSSDERKSEREKEPPKLQI